MVVNVESGSFSLAPRSRFDERFDATLPDCGAYAFEKMIGGAYLGRLGHAILQEAARAGLFSPAAATALLAMPAPDNKDLDLFCHNPQQPPTTFAALPLANADRCVIVELCTPVYSRAALFAAVNIAAAVIRTGAGHDPQHPVGVNIDGSTYYRTRTIPFAARVQEHLRRLLDPRDIHWEPLAIAESPILGAAVAGLTGPTTGKAAG